ncbi:hypothetical protein RhiirA4_470190 [Rhizophagus irregularis]|uniref:Uncharacterized protein n=1 Tax=Rhizophagus irregularis TaxID=588596 RepID=A0A2I1H0T7_9GLOM|nr:hypothetical protein RhiirA4_470190 [Rhizophagus irregularis]
MVINVVVVIEIGSHLIKEIKMSLTKGSFYGNRAQHQSADIAKFLSTKSKKKQTSIQDLVIKVYINIETPLDKQENSEIIENQGENKYGLINIFILINVDLTYQSLTDKVKPFIPKQIKEYCKYLVELHNDINIDNEIEKEYKNNLHSHLFKEDTNHTIQLTKPKQ